MDYDDPFFKSLRPETQKQQQFIWWVMMTHTDGRDGRFGHIPKFGINPHFDVFYTSLATTIQAQQIAEIAHTLDVETQKRMEELALTARNAGDLATQLGSALMTFEQEMVKRGETRFTLQLERGTLGRWSINKLVNEPSLSDAVVAYCLRRLNKQP